MADLNARDARLVQWLGEAYAKETELVADLQAHISLTQKESYKKRLREHLTQTKNHRRQVEKRIKQLGGTAAAGPDIPLVPKVAGEIAGKAVAAAKGQLGAARAAVTTQAETHLRNAHEELREEHVEIALYTRIEVFAAEVGDTETAKLAKAIRRDEQRMANFLSDEIPRLVKAIVKSDVPREQRGAAQPARASRSARVGAKPTGARAAAKATGRAQAARTKAKATRSRRTAAA